MVGGKHGIAVHEWKRTGPEWCVELGYCEIMGLLIA